MTSAVVKVTQDSNPIDERRSMLGEPRIGDLRSTSFSWSGSRAVASMISTIEARFPEFYSAYIGELAAVLLTLEGCKGNSMQFGDLAYRIGRAIKISEAGTMVDTYYLCLDGTIGGAGVNLGLLKVKSESPLSIDPTTFIELTPAGKELVAMGFRPNKTRNEDAQPSGE